MTHDACQPTEGENLEKGRDLVIPYEAHQNDIVNLVVLNADLAICRLEEYKKHKMTLAQESVHWKIVADAGVGAADAVVQDMMLLCAGFFAQQEVE